MPSASSRDRDKINRFERARIIGARSLQISSGAPILVPVSAEQALDPIKVAEMEFADDVIPITVLRESKVTAAE